MVRQQVEPASGPPAAPGEPPAGRRGGRGRAAALALLTLAAFVAAGVLVNRQSGDPAGTRTATSITLPRLERVPLTTTGPAEASRPGPVTESSVAPTTLPAEPPVTEAASTTVAPDSSSSPTVAPSEPAPEPTDDGSGSESGEAPTGGRGSSGIDGGLADTSR